MIATRLVLLAMGATAAVEPAHAALAGTAARGDSTFTIQGISILVGLFLAVVTLLMNQRTVRRQNESDAKAGKDEILGEVRKNQATEDERFRRIEGDVRALETRQERFVPGDVIDQKLEHLKVNRQQVEEKHERDIKEMSTSIRGMERQIARLEERHDGTDKMVGEVKQAIKDLSAELKAGFKEIADQRKVA